MTDEQLKAIRDRLANVTPWPWSADTLSGHIWSKHDPEEGDILIAEIRGWSYLNRKFGLAKAVKIQDANQAFIANAREDIPALLDHIGELEAQIAAMRPVVESAVKALRKIDVDEESDIACYRDEAIELLKGATNG